MQKIKNYFNGSPMAGLSAGDYGIEPAVDCVSGRRAGFLRADPLFSDAEFIYLEVISK